MANPINDGVRANLPQYSHSINHRHDFTPGIGLLYPVNVTETFPGRHVSYNVQNVLQLMPLVGDCKQDMFLYTESVFSAFHALWDKWPLFRYGAISPMADIDIPERCPYFTLRQVLNLWKELKEQPSDDGETVCKWLSPGSLLDSLYGLCNLNKISASAQPATATVKDLLYLLSPAVLDEPINGLYLRAYHHHYLINHTSEWLSANRFNMINDEYPFRKNDFITREELIAILENITYSGTTGDSGLAPVLHERDYFTAANPLPQKGAAVTISSGQTIQDLTKAIHQQEILEKDADTGTSHYQAIVQRYGVTPRSLGVMRPVPAAQPSRQVISINPIFNQSGDTLAPSTGQLTGINFQGDISGRGFSADGSHHVDYFADVDGCIITYCFIRPETIYHQGLKRQFTRIERTDFYEPAMVNDGDEPIFYEEIVHPLMRQMIPSNITPLKEVFGYRNKYLDYIHTPSRVSGDFRTTMKSWSMHRDFASAPDLNDTFIRTFDTPSRLFAYEGQPARSVYPRFVCYMQFRGVIRDSIPNFTKRQI